MRDSLRAILVLAALSATLASGCKPHIGDACTSSTKCAYNGTRFCDRSLSGGYCTIKDCDPDSCPDKAVCVEWNYDSPRAAERYCMESCSSDDDCIDREGYHCLKVNQSPELAYDGGVVPDGGTYSSIARITDFSAKLQAKGFCTYVVEPNFVCLDGGCPGDAGADSGTDGSTDAGTDGGI